MTEEDSDDTGFPTELLIGINTETSPTISEAGFKKNLIKTYHILVKYFKNTNERTDKRLDELFDAMIDLNTSVKSHAMRLMRYKLYLLKHRRNATYLIIKIRDTKILEETTEDEKLKKINELMKLANEYVEKSIDIVNEELIDIEDQIIKTIKLGSMINERNARNRLARWETELLGTLKRK